MKHLDARSAPRRQSVVATLFLWVARSAFLLGLVLAAVAVYQLLLDDIVQDGQVLTGMLLLWLFTAYVVLPRVHRQFTKWYVPNYFIGRVRTPDGLLGDPVNLALNGKREDLEAAMEAAGWVRADELNLRSTMGMIRATLTRRSYPSAPVSSLFLFSRRQDLAYQQEVGGSTSKRHHVRFWQTPEGWWLPGGYRADWLGAATFDRAVGFSAFTFQITHKIAEDTDEERDYVVDTLVEAGRVKELNVVQHFVSSYRDRNGGGDSIVTDGAMPFITLEPAGDNAL